MFKIGLAIGVVGVAFLLACMGWLLLDQSRLNQSHDWPPQWFRTISGAGLVLMVGGSLLATASAIVFAWEVLP